MSPTSCSAILNELYCWQTMTAYKYLTLSCAVFFYHILRGCSTSTLTNQVSFFLHSTQIHNLLEDSMAATTPPVHIQMNGIVTHRPGLFSFLHPTDLSWIHNKYHCPLCFLNDTMHDVDPQVSAALLLPVRSFVGRLSLIA